MKFLHPVGRSTLKYGITIPAEAQTEQMFSISKGMKVPVTITFSSGDQVTAEIRRLNNRVGQLQFRYEQSSQEKLRQFLQNTFDGQTKGDLLEIIEYAPFAFEFRPIQKYNSPRLRISEMVCHGIDRKHVEAIEEVNDIHAGIFSIEYDAILQQADYNKRINEHFVKRGWRSEQKVADGLGLRCDFEKNGVFIEVEFGNARSYYQDYIVPERKRILINKSYYLQISK